MRMWVWGLGLALAVSALAACDEDKAATAGGGGTVSAVKSDCPDCDPAGPNAFVQTGVGTTFYQPGDRWQVAFRYAHTPLAEKRDAVFLGEDRALSEAFLFDYVVTGTDRDVFDNVLRDTVTIAVTQATPAGAHGDLFSPERLDRWEKKVVFTMNDLLEPMAETLYTRDYPHGKRVRLDGKASLRMGASLYPRTIPRLLVSGAVDAPAPELPADLEDIADAMAEGWRDATYKKFVFDNGDVVYWSRARGQLWPFYSRNAQGESLLVGWNL